MSVELQQIKRRIGAARQIQKATSAMQRVAAARFAQDRRAMDRAARYTARLTRLVREAGLAAGRDARPALARPPRADAPPIAILLGSERGLCGGFNSLVLAGLEQLSAALGTQPRVLAVGRIVARKARRAGYAIEAAWPQPARAARATVLDAVCAAAVAGVAEGRFGPVHAVYARFESAARQTAAAERLLPVVFEPPRHGELRAPLCEPDPASLLERLLPEGVRQSLDQAFLHSLTAEDAARQQAMGRAAENAGGLLRELMLTFSRLRQEAITTEMIELAGGVAV